MTVGSANQRTFKRQPWSRRHALKLFEKIGVKEPVSAYRVLRNRWAADAALPAELKVHLIIAGAIAEWMEDLSQLQLVRCIERQRRLNEDCEIENALSSTFPILSTDIGAILSLCRLGYDVQARSLLRNFIEKVDLLICVKLDRDFARAYVNAGSFNDSRVFFYRNISGGKLSKRAIKLFKAAYPSADFVYDWLMTDWRSETSLMLGSAVHGNHTVSMISLFPNLGRGRSNAVGLRGHPTNGSNITIAKLIYACMPLQFILGEFCYIEATLYLSEASMDTSHVEHYRLFSGLLLTFPLVDSWLQNPAEAQAHFVPNP